MMYKHAVANGKRRAAAGLLAAALLFLSAHPASAAADRPLCPVCTQGWGRTWQVPISRTTVGESPCTHGDGTATDYIVKVQYQEMVTCTHCGAVKTGEPYTVEEVSCSLEFPAAATPAPEGEAAQPAAGSLSLAEDLTAQARAAGLQPDERMVAGHNGSLYLVRYAPPVTDWAAWQTTEAGGLFPQSLGDTAWQQGALDANAGGLDLLETGVAYRPLHDFEDWSAGEIVEQDLPAAVISAAYQRQDLLAFTLTLRRAPAPDMIGETFAQGDVTLYRQYTRDGALRRIWWQDAETGTVLELTPYAYTEARGAELLAGLVDAHAADYTAWAAA